MLRRTGFKKPERPAKVPVLLRPLDRPVNYVHISANEPAQPAEKERPVRSEAYRRLVASMRCAICKFQGNSQAAHPNFGKGMAIKVDDRLCFPLCCECHRKFDQGAMYDKTERRKVEKELGRETRLMILDSGKWPKGLPLWKNATCSKGDST